MSFSSLVSWAAVASRSLSNAAAMLPATSVPAPRPPPSAPASAPSSPGPGPYSRPVRRPWPSPLARLASYCSPRSCIRHYILLPRNPLPWALPTLTGPNLDGAAIWADAASYPPNEQRAAGSLTAESRAGRIRRRVARQAGSDGTRPTVAAACSAAMGVVDISGAWVTAASPPGPNHIMCVTGQVSEQPAELQGHLGRGPAPGRGPIG